MTIEDMQARAALKGGKCLSKKYINSITKLLWSCENGHIWETTPAIIVQGGWCPACNNLRKKHTIEDMQDWAAEKRGKCLSKEYINLTTKLLWSCENGHVWETTPAVIVQGCWCLACHKLNKKYTIKDMQDWAAAKRGKCLSKEYINMNTKLRWQCDKMHIWDTTPHSIYKGHWCPYCGNSHPLTIEEMHRTAAAKGGKCLSKKYKNSISALKWQCGKGHRWKTAPANIRSGYWCPECSGCKRLSLAEMQKIAKKRQGKCLSEIFINGKTKMEWQCREGHRWKTNSAAIKSGQWCPYCYGNVKLSIVKMRQLANEHGIQCLSDKYINSTKKLLWQCKHGHKWEAVPGSIRLGRSCPVCAGRQKKSIEDMHLLASMRGGKCLSGEYINTDTKLRWQCNKGHIWEATGHSISSSGTWCPYCYGNVKLSIKEMRQLAQSRGGNCISKKYIDRNTKLIWKCKEGHKWGATPASIKRGTWCPVCAR